MDRASLYFMNETDKNTYDFDDALPALPLPELHDTMMRYYKSIVPFGTPEELAQAAKEIEDFEHGIGAELHGDLKSRALKMKNWLGNWWEDYGYHMLRLPLLPYQTMAMAAQLEMVGLSETPTHMLKNLARISYHTLEFWDLTRRAALKPLSSNGGQIKYSSALHKLFFSTSRIPGIERDHIERHFRITSEGNTPSHATITGKGRIFIFDCVHADNSIVTAHELLIVLQRIRCALDYEPVGDGVPLLTHDERTNWAKNRLHLKEISAANEAALRLIESSSLVVCFDEREPRDYEEVAQFSLYSEFHSNWGDRSSAIIAFKNGRMAWIGEHSCYDGSVSVSYATFIDLSLLECPEPDWDDIECMRLLPFKEIQFELDDMLRNEISRMSLDLEQRGYDVTVTFTVFDGYGKDFLKQHKLQPDSFVQVVMQWAYLQMHASIAPTYETALMRHYYNGRTETLRSCTPAVHEFLKIANSNDVTKVEFVKKFRQAVDDHRHMMTEAREGRGIDRHLFGLWCAAYERQLEIPPFFDSTMYSKSGGGGNFVLSTSFLGFSANVGFVSPMVFDGYGVFYSITSENIFINTTAYRDSKVTSARKFNEVFKATLRKIRDYLQQNGTAKL